jgi:hypothetical protein
MRILASKKAVQMLSSLIYSCSTECHYNAFAALSVARVRQHAGNGLQRRERLVHGGGWLEQTVSRLCDDTLTAGVCAGARTYAPPYWVQQGNACDDTSTAGVCAGARTYAPPYWVQQGNACEIVHSERNTTRASTREMRWVRVMGGSDARARTSVCVCVRARARVCGLPGHR